MLALAPSYLLFTLFIIILGAGAGLYYTVATTRLVRLFTNTGRAIGVHGTGGPMAGLVAPVIVTWIAVQYSWREAVLFGALLTGPLLAATFWHIPVSRRHARDNRSQNVSIRAHSVLSCLGRTLHI